MSAPKHALVVVVPELAVDLKARPVPASLPLPGSPSLFQKAARLSTELRGWVTAGLPVAPRHVRAARAAACLACPYFDAAGNAGLGECRAPGCGCTKFKRWLASAACPHPQGSRWPAG